MDRGLFRYYRLLILFLIAAPVMLPLWATVIGGFKTTGDLRTNAFGLPREWIVDNYIEILTGHRFWQMLGNSGIIALVSTVLTVLVSSMVAFTLSHMHFAGRKFIGNYLALGLTFPFATAVLPVFIRVRDLGLLDTYWGLILPQVAFNLGFSVVILQGFFAQLPKELLESAVVDGCSYTRFFFQITLPLSRPVLATVGVLALVGSWNAFLLPLVMINSESLYPWPLGIMQYQGQYGTDWGKVLAYISLTLAPAILFYLAAQKHIIAGLTSGAVKG